MSEPEEEQEWDVPSQPGSRKAPPSKKKKSAGSGVADTLREYLQQQDQEAQEVRAEVNILSFCIKLHEHPLHTIVIH